ncbi:helix-turn-helix domain-containing protein [Streptomyces lavendulocolor]|uniref:helix-turn-helix domain-containing protein n=1 Tax=Streptomyces lavendulocolor TaxID=67316 RepID=UPI0033EFE6AF
MTNRLRAELPSYARVPPDLLTLRVARAMDRSLTVVHRLYGQQHAKNAGPALPTRDTGSISRAGTSVTIGDTLPVDDVIRAHRIGVDVVWSRFTQEMTERGAHPQELLAVGEHVWSWAADMTVRILRRRAVTEDTRPANAHRPQEPRLEEYVRMLLLVPAGAAAGRGADTPTAARMPFRARAALGPTDTGRVIELLQPWIAAGPGRGLMVTTVDGDVAGLLAARPPALLRDLVVGLGAAVPSCDVADEFRSASLALRVATSFELAGVYTGDELGLRTVVVQRPDLGERLVHQRLAPLRERGEEGTQIEEAVAAFLEHGLRLEAAARSLFVHPNTLRNRLRRFEGLSGTSLRDPADMAEIWWALAHRRVHGPVGVAAPPDGPEP